MTLRQLMAADFPTVLADLGESVTVTPVLPEGVSSTTFAVSGVFGDMADSYQAVQIGSSQSTAALFVCQRSLWRAAMTAASLTARDPFRGDQLVVASGEYAGTWFVQLVGNDQGDGITLTCLRPQFFKLGDPAALPVGG